MASSLAQLVQSNRVKSDTTTDAGKGLFAAAHIQLDHAILEVYHPTILALDTPRLKDTCYSCLLFTEKSGPLKRNEPEQDKTLKACTGCSVVRYCNTECQTRSWTDHHKLECKTFAKLRPNILPNNVRAIMRLLFLQKAKRVSQAQWDQLMDLEAHVNDFRKAGGETWQNMCLMAKAAKEYSGTGLDEHTVLGLFARLMINCFTLVTPTYDPLGLVLHPLPARLNHSCEHNAIIRFRTGHLNYVGPCLTLEVVPMRQIKKGEQILISYVDATHPFINRQRELRERYFFACQCSKCLLGPTTPIDKFLAGPTALDADEVQKVENRCIELLKGATTDTSLTGPIQKLKYALHLLRQTQVWPIIRHPLPSIRHQLILAYLDAHQFNLALAQAAVQRFRTDPELMPEKHHPVRMVHDWVFVRLIDHILDSEKNEWASQKLDLGPYGIDLAFWRAYIICDLQETVGLVPSSTFSSRVWSRWQQGRNRTYAYGAVSNHDSKEKLKKEVELIDRVIEDVLESELVY